MKSCLWNNLLFPRLLSKRRRNHRKNATSLKLCLKDAASIKASIAQVRRANGKTISSLCLSNYPSADGPCLKKLLVVIQEHFPNLQELEIDRNSLDFPRQELAALLEQTRGTLKVLSLGRREGCQKDNNNNLQDNLEGIHSALRNHPSLEKAFLGPCSIDAYLPAIVTCPKLTSLEVRVSRGIANPSKAVEEICECLQSNPTSQTLKQLSIRARFQDMEAIAKYLSNNTTLEELNLSGFSNYTSGNPPSLVPVAQALKTNQSLKRLNFGDYHHYVYSLPKAHAQTFIDMIKNHNMVLEDIVLAGTEDEDCELRLPSSYEQLVPFYCRLNQLGRKHLLQTEETKDWVENLIANHQDHQAIFHLLSMNPTLLP